MRFSISFDSLKRNSSCQFPDERKWALQNDCWLPEHSDHPLQGEPTRLGVPENQRGTLADKQRSKSETFHRSHTMPEIRY